MLRYLFVSLVMWVRVLLAIRSLSSLSTESCHSCRGSNRRSVSRLPILRHIGSIMVITSRGVFVVVVPGSSLFRLPMNVGSGVKIAVMGASGFFILIVVVVCSRVMRTGRSGSSCSSDVSVKSLPPPSLEHKEDECKEPSGNGETDNDECTSDGASVVEETR